MNKMYYVDLEDMILMEQVGLISNEEILSEGLGFGTWWKTHAVGEDKKLEEKVRGKLHSIKTEQEKQELIKDLQKLKKTAQTLNGTKDSNKGDFWSDLWTGFQSGAATGILSYLGIIPIIIRLVKKYNGTADNFIEIVDNLIEEVQTVKVK